MIDEKDSLSKETSSTLAEETVNLNSMTSVIYMDYYEENLDEYLIKKGKLETFEVLCLIRQIF
jgi:hypothetical protein